MRWILVDRVLECEPGKWAVGIKCFTRTEPFFEDHLQGNPPIVPGVLQIEMIAALGGICVRDTNSRIQPFLACVKSAKFHRFIEPGDRCLIKSTIEVLHDSYFVINGTVHVDDKMVAEAKVISSISILPEEIPLGKNPVLSDWKRRKGSILA